MADGRLQTGDGGLQLADEVGDLLDTVVSGVRPAAFTAAAFSASLLWYWSAAGRIVVLAILAVRLASTFTVFEYCSR